MQLFFNNCTYLLKMNKKGITLIEVMIALLVLGVMLIPVFSYLSGAVMDTEKIYTEAVAISKAKFIMDTMMNQIPFKAIIESNGTIGCEFTGLPEENYTSGFMSMDVSQMPGYGNASNNEKRRMKTRLENRKKEVENVNTLLSGLIPKMFGDGCGPVDTYKWNGCGHYTDPKGFVYYCVANVKNEGIGYNGVREDDSIFKSGSDKDYRLKNFVTTDSTSKGAYMKKIIVQVMWVPQKGIKNPEDPKYSNKVKSVFLVGFKYNLE